MRLRKHIQLKISKWSFIDCTFTYLLTSYSAAFLKKLIIVNINIKIERE